MPARGRYHQQVRTALEKDGWTITQDAFRVSYGGHELTAEFAAEREREGDSPECIAVQVATGDTDPSSVGFQRTLGRFMLCDMVLSEMRSPRRLFLAITRLAFEAICADDTIRHGLSSAGVRMLVLDEQCGSV